jgi:hypothetical protein
MKKEIIKGFVYLEGVKTAFNEDFVKGLSFEEFKSVFQGKVVYTNQAKDLQPELNKIFEAIAGKKKPIRRKNSDKK